MGLFTFFGTLKSKSEVESILENLLQMQYDNGTITVNPKHVATLCMLKAWQEFPDVFNGNFGQRPHKLIGVAVGLAVVINTTERDNKDFSGLLLAFFTVLSEIETNINYYPFKKIDFEMLDRMSPIIESEMETFNERYGERADQLRALLSNHEES